MTKLFDKAIVFTDIHFGLKNDSAQHNNDCISFINWMISVAKDQNIDTCVFCGDYFHNRKFVNSSTLLAGMSGLSLLNDNFKNTYFLVGNHDMYHKNRRDINSTNIAGLYPNIKFIKDITTIKDSTFVPFLIEDEHLSLTGLDSTFVFGHFELPGYLLNKMSEMPDHGKENHDMFNSRYVISGHFHKRQQKTNKHGTKIIYTGNCFGHNFSDSWDDERGLMIIDHSSEPVFIEWPDAPTYRDIKYTDFVTKEQHVCKKNGTIKIYLDELIDTQQMGAIRDRLKQNGIRDVIFAPIKTSVNDIDENAIEQALEVQETKLDNIVISQLQAVKSDTLDNQLLVQLYLDLENNEI